MHLGYSSECINPVSEVELSGYGWYLNRMSTGVIHDIFVHTLFLQHEKKSFLIITCDTLALSDELVDNAKSALTKLLPINKAEILFLSIHTHTAPAVVSTIGCGEPNSDYIALLFDKIILSAVLAFKKQYKINSIEYGSCPVEQICQNRRTENGPVDLNVYAIRFNLDGQKPYFLVQYGCHPVAHGIISEISPDYPGFVLKALNDRGFNGMFLTGCCGDIDPTCRIERQGGTTSELTEYGLKIAEGAIKATQNTIKSYDFKSFDFIFNLEADEISSEYADELWHECFENDPDLGKRTAAREWIDEIKAGTISSKEEVYVQVLMIGNIVIIGAPGELSANIGQQIRKNLSDYFIFICENANGAMRYVASDNSILSKEYEGFWSNIVYRTFPLKPGAEQKYIKNLSRCHGDGSTLSRGRFY